MSRQALFAGLVVDEQGQPVETAVVGDEAQYVIDDAGFQRHVDAEAIDRQVLAIFLEQLYANEDMAVEQTLNFLGKDDLMTKAAIEASLRNINMDQILDQGIPSQARDMMGMMGFRIIVNYHGEVVGLDQPAAPDDEGDY